MLTINTINNSLSDTKLIKNPNQLNNMKIYSNFSYKSDYLEMNSLKKHKQIAFSGFFSNLISNIVKTQKTNNSIDRISSTSYAQKISEGIKENWGQDIPSKNFKAVMEPDELKNFIKNLNYSNFVSKSDNQRLSTYKADLDYITTFSYNGNGAISDVLNNVAAYSHSYFNQTGRKFVFSITDNDTVEGLKHALAFIGEHPNKFKHLTFIPGVKVSFAYKVSDTRYENSKMLVYGINPFSENINKFIDRTLQKREAMICDFIDNASELYRESFLNKAEFYEQNNTALLKDFGQSNLYWRVKEYIDAKGDVSISGVKIDPKEIFDLSEDVFSGMDKVFRGSENQSVLNLYSELTDNTENTSILIKRLFEQYSTHYNKKTKKMESSAENIYSNLIACLSKETPRPIMALSEPYYFSHHFESKDSESYKNVLNFIKYLQRNSKGMLVGFESVAPSYDLDKGLLPKTIKNFNHYIKNNTNLSEVGGSFATIETDKLPFSRN